MRENKGTKVWVVVVDTAYDYEVEIGIKIFSTPQKAKECFNKHVIDEMACDHLMEYEDKVVEKNETHFSIWQDGYYCKDHFTINIYEKEVF